MVITIVPAHRCQMQATHELCGQSVTFLTNVQRYIKGQSSNHPLRLQDSVDGIRGTMHINNATAIEIGRFLCRMGMSIIEESAFSDGFECAVDDLNEEE